MASGNMDKNVKRIREKKIIAIIRGLTAEEAVKASRALFEGGIQFMEVTFDQNSQDHFKNTIEAIINIKNDNPEIHIGAGTVMTIEQVEMAINAGAEFIISPNVDFEVIKRTKELKALSIPGAFTPSEVTNAYNAGADFVKVFPAGDMSANYIKSLKGPLGHIPLLAVGGIDHVNMKDFYKAGCCGFGIGGNLVNKALIREEKYDELKKTAECYVEAAEKLD